MTVGFVECGYGVNCAVQVLQGHRASVGSPDPVHHDEVCML